VTRSSSPPSQLGRYRILEQLGQGGMGTVYLAEDTVLSRRVAIKVPHLDGIDADMLQRFYREARCAAAIEHPNVCPILDVAEHDGVPFLVMPFVEGLRLTDLVGPTRAWFPSRAAALVRKLALAVAELHSRGLIHRDVKPGNVLLRTDGEPILVDFGLARSFLTETPLLTATGAVCGTPAYMAPEQVRGENRSVGPATDVYALGAILYQLLTGQVPFPGPGPAVYAQILHDELPPPSARVKGLEPTLDAVCLRAMARDPAKRFGSATELAAALEGPAGSATNPEVTTTPFVPTVEQAETDHNDPTVAARPAGWKRFAWLVPAGVVLLVVVTVLAVIISRGSDGSGRRPVKPPDGSADADEWTNTIGMKLVRVKPGKFLMGSPPNEAGREPSDEQQHEVTITRPFSIGAYEVTQDEYEQVMGKDKNPSSWTTARAGVDTSRFPVDSVTWHAADAFCRALTEKEKALGRRYRLPTEAQWEYACRGGHRFTTAAPFHFREPIFRLDSTLANWDYQGEKLPGGPAKSKPLGRPAPVGSYAPNALGLYDMHGNVGEWCDDGNRSYGRDPVSDPVGPPDKHRRIVRGGSWVSGSRYCRAAGRGNVEMGDSIGWVGFRVVCVP
jgi:serine/threonine protein kinase